MVSKPTSYFQLMAVVDSQNFGLGVSALVGSKDSPKRPSLGRENVTKAMHAG